MQTQSNRNAYHRLRYALNIEKERERQREKYYRTRKLLSDLTEEEIEIKREKNRINYEKWLIRQGKEVKERKPETQFKKPIKQRKLKTHNMVPKKNKTTRENKA
jgi:DNA-binding transcriptional regulator PaaX